MLRNILRATTLLGLALLAVVLPASAQVDTGSANFTTYVAVGDSLTAAFMSGGLVETAQRNSYPALIYRQATGRTTGFEQPLVSAPGLPALQQLRSLVPLSIGQAAGTGNPINLTLQRPYNNLAVPGADVHDVLFTVSGGLNDLILRGLGTQLQQAVVQRPTFVTLWIGNNDALAAALAGVINDSTLTPLSTFTDEYRQVVTALNGTGARMAIANIPNVTAIPYVNTVPRVVVNPQTNQPVLNNGQPIPLIGPNGPLGAGDRVLLTATAELAQGRGLPPSLGGTGPLSDSAVLSAAEIATINSRIAAFNQVIQSEANRVGAAFVDMNSFLNQAATTGLRVGGMTFTPAFLTGGIFSLDGVHPTPFGYAYIANVFIEAINDQFDGDIPPVDLYPFLFGPKSGGEASLQAGQMWVTVDPIAVRNLFWALNVSQVTESNRPADRPRNRRRTNRNGKH
jgi:lysophospholipase L1-like esterase